MDDERERNFVRQDTVDSFGTGTLLEILHSHNS